MQTATPSPPITALHRPPGWLTCRPFSLAGNPAAHQCAAGGITRITAELLIVAAKALAGAVSENQIRHECLYPQLNEIRQVSLQITVAVAEAAAARGFTTVCIGKDFRDHFAAAMYDLRYWDSAADNWHAGTVHGSSSLCPACCNTLQVPVFHVDSGQQLVYFTPALEGLA